MKMTLLAVPAMVIGFALSPGVFAQAPAGEATPQQPRIESDRTRAQARAECLEALKAGKGPTGECAN